MKRKNILLTVLTCFSLMLSAQKPVVFVAPFEYAGKDVRQLLPSFRAAVLDGVTWSKRVDIIDSSTDSTQTSILNAAKQANANFIFKCKMDNHNASDAVNLIKAIENIATNKTQSMTDHLSYNVELIRVSDGVSIDVSKLSTEGYSYSDKALNNSTEYALGAVQRQIRRYFEKLFPVNAKIAEIAEMKKDKLKKVYITVGSNAPIRKDLYFNVYIEKKVAGETIRDLIGKVRIDEIKGENISLCTVKKGAKEIKDALEQESDLALVSTVD